jgi:hypothetical protein
VSGYLSLLGISWAIVPLTSLWIALTLSYGSDRQTDRQTEDRHTHVHTYTHTTSLWLRFLKSMKINNNLLPNGIIAGKVVGAAGSSCNSLICYSKPT